jgi:hypothetical protein
MMLVSISVIQSFFGVIVHHRKEDWHISASVISRLTSSWYRAPEKIVSYSSPLLSSALRRRGAKCTAHHAKTVPSILMMRLLTIFAIMAEWLSAVTLFS